MTLQDAALPQLSNALIRRHVRSLLAEHIVPRFFGHRTLTDIPMLYTRYKAGKTHVALYALDLNPPLDGDPPLVTVTFGRESLLQRTASRIAANGSDEATHTIFIPGEPCLIQLFPADYELPLLWRAADPVRASNLLSSLLQSPVRVRAIERLRYRPSRRCVLAYEFEQPVNGAAHAIAKLYRKPEHAQAVAAKLTYLNQNASLAVPTLLAPPGDSTLLLMQRLPGQNLGDLLEQTTDSTKIERAMRNAAATLAALHQQTLAGPPERTVSSEFENLRARLGPVHSVAPDLAAPIEAVLQRIEAELLRHISFETCAVHGEYKPNQLLVDGDRVAVVDLDRACNGNPAVDVGNFAASLRKEVVLDGHAHLANAHTAFLDAYLGSTGRTDIVSRAALVQAIASLRMLTRSFERMPRQYEVQRADWRPLTLLDEARRVLDTL